MDEEAITPDFYDDDYETFLREKKEKESKETPSPLIPVEPTQKTKEQTKGPLDQFLDHSS